MDLQAEYLADNDRYAFLLGSALRNDDSEHFFCIYDSIIPSELSDIQVEKIKEQARVIADLPEDEFNELVLNARDYSLARGRPSPSPILAMSTNGQEVLRDHSDEADGQVSSLVTKLDFSTSASSHRFLVSGVKDDDSGLPSSTKTGRHASLSSDDTLEMEEKDHVESICPYSLVRKENDVGEMEEERTEVPRLRDLVVVSHSYNPDYDEEVPVEHDDESIESPRSDASSTREYDLPQLDGEDAVEMKTFNSEQHPCYYDDEDSDDGIRSSLYTGRNSWRTMESSRPASSASSINFTRSSKYLAEGKTISSLRSNTATSASTKISNVDESVNFSLGSFSAQPRYSPDRGGALSGLSLSPPFGTGKDLLNKVGESVSSLMKISSQDPCQTKAETDGDTWDKKRQRQKKTNKDDGTREGGNSGKILTKDINGNPAETEGSQQMREAHPLDDKSSVVSVSGRPGSSGTHNHEMGHTQGEDLASSHNSSRRPRRKRNARQQGIEVHPDQDESYVGNVSDIDNLVKYINNDISAKNLKEIDGSNGSSLPSGPPSTVHVKLPKKKERNKVKTEIPGVAGSCDTSDTPWASSQSEYSAAKQAESKELTGTLDDKDKKMGNSSTTEKLDASEDGVDFSSSSIIVKESENNNKKIPKRELKRESGKNQKNHVVTNSKISSNTKQTKNNDDKTKEKLKDSSKDADAEETKVKNSKKGKSKSMKKDSQEEPKKREGALPSPPAMPENDELFGSTQGQWCTVSKKKRSQTQASVVQNCYSPPFPHQTRSKDLQVSPSPYPVDASRRNQQQNASQHPPIKPVSYAQAYFKTAESDKREKDLSPSDFPVLNSSPRDHRLSLENVFEIGALVSDKDSDKESSKSFPADISLGGRSRTSFPVSYASMASGNAAHESIDSSKAESVSSSVEDSSVEFSANSSSLKWKGSPQERRHSFGSAPKELSKNILQRSGSQEMLPCDKDLMSPSVTIPNKIVSSNCKNLVSSESTGSFTSSDADSARGSEVGSEGIGEEFTTITPTNIDTTTHSGTSVETKKTAVHAAETIENAKMESEKAVNKSIPVDSVHRSQTVRSETKTSSSGAKQVNNGRKKGVVFFCNKNEKSTPITGLHFGFFHEEEYASIMTNSASNKPSVPVNGEEVSQSDNVDSLCGSSLSSFPQQPPHAATAASSSSTFGDHCSKPPKGPHIAGLNGLVSPHTPDNNPALVLQTSSNPAVVNEQIPTQLESTGPATVCSVSSSDVCPAALTSEPTQQLQDRIIVTYGGQYKNEPLKYAVYIRPPEETVKREPSKDFIMTENYLAGMWKWNNSNWERVVD
ncbi:uncharacterized protein LOC143287851 [Babylonia areolata]|uniref:uncharacterized protein LOC143287851 n=1 Tax=Babylonia areolata TaxID=304850 RepID=UPI003FD56AAC